MDNKLTTTLSSRLAKRIREEGFDSFGICGPGDIPKAGDRLNDFLEKNYHGDMKWLYNRADWRGNPSSLWPDTRSIIMLAESYGNNVNSIANLKNKNRGTISSYAQNQDYHEIIKKKLKNIGRWLIKEVPNSQIKVFVDTAPVMEKPLAEAAGLGWQGKHTNLVSRTLGNWFFLGTIFTTIELSGSNAELDHCGSCRRCLDICPTNAFPAPYQLDARKCISYLTIEHEGPVKLNLRKKMGNRIFGCDDCLEVCPWNKFAITARENRYHARKELKSPLLDDLVKLDDRSFRDLFRKSPIKRIGRNRFVRNVLYAIGNSGDRKLVNSATKLCTDHDPTVADAARWAVTELKSSNGI